MNINRRAGMKNRLGAKQHAPKAPGPRRRRRPGREVWGGGFPHPIQIGGLGSVLSSPAVSGAEPRRKTNLVHSAAVRRPLVANVHIVL